MYLRDPETGLHTAFQLHVLAVGADGISHVVAFHMPSFAKLGRPDTLE